MHPIVVPVAVLPHAEGLELPAYATGLSAGMDLRAAIPEDAPVEIDRGGRALVPAGIQIALPSGFEAQVRPRSGLAARHGVTVLNSPGTIDADYRGEVKVILINLGDEPFLIRRGDRIAQLVVAAHGRVEWQNLPTVPPTARGEGGFGSTGRG
jgi:dUTP pyrophosphatase